MQARLSEEKKENCMLEEAFKILNYKSKFCFFETPKKYVYFSLPASIK